MAEESRVFQNRTILVIIFFVAMLIYILPVLAIAWCSHYSHAYKQFYDLIPALGRVLNLNEWGLIDLLKLLAGLLVGVPTAIAFQGLKGKASRWAVGTPLLVMVLIVLVMMVGSYAVQIDTARYNSRIVEQYGAEVYDTFYKRAGITMRDGLALIGIFLGFFVGNATVNQSPNSGSRSDSTARASTGNSPGKPSQSE